MAKNADITGTINATSGNVGTLGITSKGLHSKYTDSQGDTYEIYITPAGFDVRKMTNGYPGWDTWENRNWYEMANEITT